MSTLAQQVQDEVVSYLSARAELAGVTVVGRRKRNIVNDIAAIVGKQGKGFCLYVFPALPVELNSNNPGPYVDKLLLRVRAIENPLINTTGPDAYALTELVVRLLDRKQFTAIAGLNPLWWPPNPVQLVDDAPELVQFDIVALTSCGLEPRVD